MAGQPVNEATPGSECIHCGFCLETCPTYVLTGKEEESPRGRILLAHALEDNRASVEPATMAPLDHCLGCLACETACPSGVRYRDILFEARYRAEARGHVRHPVERFLLEHVIAQPARLAVLAFLYRVLRVRAVFRAAAKWLPEPMRNRALLSPSFESPSSKRVAVPAPADAPKAILVRGCAARVFMPASEDAMAHLLESAGYRVERRDQPRCCGALAHHAGMQDLAQELGEETVHALGKDEDAIVVTTAAGCTAHLRDLASIVPHHQMAPAREMGSRVRDLSQALLDAPRRLMLNARPERVVFQDPCHLRHAEGIVLEPRQLLQEAGARLIEPDQAELCCGSAGSYHLAAPELSLPLALRKRDALLATGADTVVTANPGCWMQLRAVWPRNGPRLTTLACFLEERLGPGGGLPSAAPVHDHSSSSNSGTNAS